MERQRGFTLIEVLITVGIISIVTAGSVGLAQSSRSEAVTLAALRFDTLLDAALTTAHEFDHGATIVFARDTAGDGFTARVYRNRPSAGPLVATTLPVLEARVAITETATLGTPPFALTIHGDEAIAGISGDVVSASASTETPCPLSGQYHLVLSYAGFHVDRSLPCRTNLASTGTVAYQPIVAATPQAPPTPFACVGASCATPPTMPKTAATCPPGYIAKDAATCVSASSIVTPAPTPTATPTPYVGGAATPTPTPSALPVPISPNMCDDLRRWGRANGFPSATDDVFGYFYGVSDHNGPFDVFTGAGGNLETTESYDYTPAGYEPYASSTKLVSIYDSVPDVIRWVCQSAP